MIRSVALWTLMVAALSAVVFAQTAIPASDFGMVVNPPVSKPGFPLEVSYGSFRVWDSGTGAGTGNSQWEYLQVCTSTPANCQTDPATYVSLNTAALDTVLSNTFKAGITDGVLFTMSRTPSWATSAPGYSDWVASSAYPKFTYVIPTVNNAGNYVYVAANSGTSGSSAPNWKQQRGTDTTDSGVIWYNIGQEICSYGGLACLVPPDLHPDGSGPNAIWDNWVIRIATYVNDSTYLKTHPHIKYWEPQNEWFSDNTVNIAENPPNGWVLEETNATFAQMLRMTEDTRCIIEGVGMIHNYPNAFQHTSCASYLSTIGQSGPIDATALVTQPSNDPNNSPDMNLSQNFMYCNNSPAKDYNGSTTCTWAPSGGLVTNCDYVHLQSCWGSQAVDVINYHFYDYFQQPEGVTGLLAKIRGFQSNTDDAKPIISGEGSMGAANHGSNIWNDDASRSGFIPRFYALYWSGGLSGNWWYAYNGSGELADTSGLLPEGTAYNTAYRWLVGGTPTTAPFCQNNLTGYASTVYACSFTGSNLKQEQLVWDSQYGPGGNGTDLDCSSSSNPTICGNTSYTVPSQYGGGWYDINNTLHSHQATVTVGAVPILLVAN